MRLRELREKLKITQTEVARISGINLRNYNKYENGVTQPDIETLIKLADFYHTTVDYIIGRDTDMVNLNGLDTKKAKLVKDVLSINDRKVELMQSYLDGLNEK